MTAFGNKAFQSKKEQAQYAKTFMGRYSNLVKKNSFLYMGLPMMLSLALISVLMTNFTSLRYERRDERVKEIDEDEALKLATQKKRKVNINDEYYKLQGLMEESKDFEEKRVKRLPGESENVW
ncbi:DEKNAAC101675 [Brettanomyces naardenensis]|uniref:Cytochrome c oxidase assembly protein COX16, mitochondrial n=1 Tax=Brettanomyces naardenensis TaxID=13370 RepID=A0A448YIQ1_BRENA|nr:DEKNAAC101675 [Brettanomyces naardenensis]